MYFEKVTYCTYRLLSFPNKITFFALQYSNCVECMHFVRVKNILIFIFKITIFWMPIIKYFRKGKKEANFLELLEFSIRDKSALRLKQNLDLLDAKVPFANV